MIKAMRVVCVYVYKINIAALNLITQSNLKYNSHKTKPNTEYMVTYILISRFMYR